MVDALRELCARGGPKTDEYGALQTGWTIRMPALRERDRRLLSEAAGHRDPGYRARALYVRSKASNHLWSLKQDPNPLDHAIRDAEEAAKLSYDDSYISCYERLQQARIALAHGEEFVAEGTQ